VSISANGRFVTFDSNITVPGIQDSNGTNDVFVYDIRFRKLSRLSVSRFGNRSANGSSVAPRISTDGRTVVFRSQASDLVEGDGNGLQDAFVCDVVTRRVEFLPRRTDGSVSGGAPSLNPVVSGDGRTTVFQTLAGDLVPGDYNQSGDLFARFLPEPVALSLGGSVEAGRVRFALEGPVGVRVVLEASPDLVGWVPVATNILPAALELETEGVEAVPTGFYRTLVLP
jgi:hypothetical protein